MSWPEQNSVSALERFFEEKREVRFRDWTLGALTREAQPQKLAQALSCNHRTFRYWESVIFVTINNGSSTMMFRILIGE